MRDQKVAAGVIDAIYWSLDTVGLPMGRPTPEPNPTPEPDPKPPMRPTLGGGL
jgi:hypothetical protein